MESHQAIEKFLKFRDDCNIITAYYIELRYPVHFGQKTKKQAKEAVETAEKIKKIVEGLIK
ncbi:MAG: HEPN domain-containing protein [bacterium]